MSHEDFIATKDKDLGLAVRKLRTDESILFDKTYNFCNKPLIMMWDWKFRQYVSPRCSNPHCNFNND
jgi:hypothetical protein